MKVLEVKKDFIPDDIKNLNNFVVWKLEERTSKKGTKRKTKVPYNPTTGKRADVTNSDHRSSFENAISKYESTSSYVGVGIVLDKGSLIAIDLDHCRDPKTGEIDQWALDIIKAQNSYTEISPSGTGIRILIYGKLPKGWRRKGKIEMYNSERYVTLTGHHLSGTPHTVEKRDKEILILREKIGGLPKKASVRTTKKKQTNTLILTPLSDAELIEKAKQARNGAKFEDLWDGDHSGYESESEATQAILHMLAFWTDCDSSRMDSLFRQSGLMRPKWDEKRGNSTWGANEIDTAISRTHETYTSQHRKKTDNSKDLCERVILNPDLCFDSNVLETANQFEKHNPVEFRKLRNAVKKTKTPMPLWDRHRKEHATERIKSNSDVQTCEYFAKNDEMFWFNDSGVKSEIVRLANFAAYIATEINHVDGVESSRSFELKITQGKKTVSINIPASQLKDTTWALNSLGASAIVGPSPRLRERFIAAIQTLSASRGIESKTVYTYLGWIKTSEGCFYLHASGAIGVSGQCSHIDVKLNPPFDNYSLSIPRDDKQRNSAINEALKFLSITPEAPIAPVIFCAVFRAAITGCDFSVWLAGPTGTYKTALAAAAQSFFGKTFDQRNLPANWSSTENSLEMSGFIAKDTLLVIDDYAPVGGIREKRLLDAKADRLGRGQGNVSGKARLNKSSEMIPAKPPRGLILGTGEDVPPGHSLRARLFILEMLPSSVKLEVLSAIQEAGRRGTLSQVMGSFVQWQATDKHRDKLLKLRQEFVEKARKQHRSVHGRCPDMIADLRLGYTSFIEFATGCGAITTEEGEAICSQCEQAIIDVSNVQYRWHRDADTASTFLSMLRSVLESGQCHIANADGSLSDGIASVLGWRKDKSGDMYPMGRNIGIVDSDSELFYLNPHATLAEVIDLAERSGKPMATTSRAMGRDLANKGFLAKTDKDRHTVKYRKDDKNSRYWCIAKSTLFGK